MRNENIIAEIEVLGNRIVNKIPVGLQPDIIVLSNNGRFLYVVNKAGNTVSVIDVAINEEVTRIPVGKLPHGIGLRP